MMKFECLQSDHGLSDFHRHFSYQFLNTDNTHTSQISTLSEPNKTFNFTLWREGIVKIGIYYTFSQGGELDLDIFFVILDRIEFLRRRLALSLSSPRCSAQKSFSQKLPDDPITLYKSSF